MIHNDNDVRLKKHHGNEQIKNNKMRYGEI